mgnify:CR=1 FL=1
MTDQGKKDAPRPSDRTLVIIPTFNELENLPLIMGRVHKALPDVHILVVDDGSPDGTGQLADELALADPDRVHVMHRDAKDGLGAAYLAGFAWGLGRQYSVLVEMDADGSHAPEQLYRLLDAVDAGADPRAALLPLVTRLLAGGDDGRLAVEGRGRLVGEGAEVPALEGGPAHLVEAPALGRAVVPALPVVGAVVEPERPAATAPGSIL